MARRLDEQPAAVELHDGLAPAPGTSDSGLSPDARRMLEAIEGLPEDEREEFDLVRIQGMTQPEPARGLGGRAMPVMRRGNAGPELVTVAVGGLRQDTEDPDTPGGSPPPGRGPRHD